MTPARTSAGDRTRHSVASVQTFTAHAWHERHRNRPPNFPAELSRRTFPPNFPAELSRRTFPPNFPAELSRRTFPLNFPAELSLRSGRPCGIIVGKIVIGFDRSESSMMPVASRRQIGDRAGEHGQCAAVGRRELFSAARVIGGARLIKEPTGPKRVHHPG